MADYIDRQALDVVAFTDRDGTFSDAIQWLLEYIDALPSADVQPVQHGWWIEEPNCMYRCSSCGSHYPSMRGYMDYCYCPSCGARMDGE